MRNSFFKIMAFITLSGLLITTNNVYAGDPDVNDDGIVDGGDIATAGQCMHRNLAENAQCNTADTNEDGIIDNKDIRFIVSQRGETGFDYTKNIELEDLIFANGSPYPNNIIIIFLYDGEPRATAEEIASLVNGKIAGFIGILNLYQIELPTSTDEGLQIAIDIASSDIRVESALRDRAASSFGMNDNSFLDPVLIQPFSLSSIDQSWELIAATSPQLSEVHIGVLDTGVNMDHPEFIGVSLKGDSPDTIVPYGNICKALLGLEDKKAHGTAVVGIIGANNISALDLSKHKDIQMNGVLSGVPDSLSSSGSEVRYKIAVSDKKNSFSDYVYGIKKLIDLNVDVINLSNGYIRRSGIDANDIVTTPLLKQCFGVSDYAFDIYRDKLTSIFSENPQITFVVSAGNKFAVKDQQTIDDITPANIEMNNVITVAGTDAAGNKAALTKTGYGIDIAAPISGYYVPFAFTGPLSEDDYFKGWSGTSASAPLVTGIIGLMKAITPTTVPLTPVEIKKILQETGDPTGSSIGGKRINAMKAVACVLNKNEYFINLEMLSAIDIEAIENVIDLPLCKKETASIEGIGLVPGNTMELGVQDVSADGSTIVGTESAAEGGVRWTKHDGLQAVWATGRAWGANSNGATVVGSKIHADILNGFTGLEAVRWNAQSGARFLGRLHRLYPSAALDVSADGDTVVGGSTISNIRIQSFFIQTEAFKWTSSLGMRRLGFTTFQGNRSSSEAAAVSADGNSIAINVKHDNGDVAYLWSSGIETRLQDLSTTQSSSSNGISSDGRTIVGSSVGINGQEAVIWTENGDVVGLGFLPSGTYSEAYAVSGDGSVVIGKADGVHPLNQQINKDTAFIWDRVNGMRKLRDVLSQQGVDMSDWFLTDAKAISDDGKTVSGNGVFQSSFESYLANILPDTSSPMMSLVPPH